MDIFTSLLLLHITGGGLSLLIGSYLMLTKKGTSPHRKLGRIYFYSMGVTALAAIPMSYLHPNFFLFLISIFTLYMLLTGVLYLRNRNTERAGIGNWSITIGMVIFVLLFVYLGILNIVKGNYFGTIFILFSIIGAFFIYQDYLNFTGKSSVKNYYLTAHLQRMSGSYIASCTAFLVVNNTLLPSLIAWSLPTILVVPLIVKWTRKYKIKKKGA